MLEVLLTNIKFEAAVEEGVKLRSEGGVDVWYPCSHLCTNPASIFALTVAHLRYNRENILLELP